MHKVDSRLGRWAGCYCENADPGLCTGCTCKKGTAGNEPGFYCDSSTTGACTAVLEGLCGGAKASGAADCFVCCGSHQSALKAVGDSHCRRCRSAAPSSPFSSRFSGSPREGVRRLTMP